MSEKAKHYMTDEALTQVVDENLFLNSLGVEYAAEILRLRAALRQARNEGLEEAAGGCALNAKECRVLSRKAEGETRLILRERASAYEACAYMIRALKEDHEMDIDGAPDRGPAAHLANHVYQTAVEAIPATPGATDDTSTAPPE